jgi:hypothetical protein
MAKAVVRRRVSSVIFDSPTRTRCQVLKFDRRAGLVMMDKPEPPTRRRRFVILVRNLLSFLRLIPPARGSTPRGNCQRSRLRWNEG